MDQLRLNSPMPCNSSGNSTSFFGSKGMYFSLSRSSSVSNSSDLTGVPGLLKLGGLEACDSIYFHCGLCLTSTRPISIQLLEDQDSFNYVFLAALQKCMIGPGRNLFGNHFTSIRGCSLLTGLRVPV